MTTMRTNGGKPRSRARFWGGIIVIVALVLGIAVYGYFINITERQSPSDVALEAIKPSFNDSLPPESELIANRVLSSPGERVMVGEKAFLLQSSHSPLKGDALSVVESLVPAAEAGDPVAAFNIYLKISSCRSAFDNRVGEQLSAIYEKAGVDPVAAASNVESTLANCQKIFQRSDLLDRRWLELAAKNGSIEAKLLYAIDVSASLGSRKEMLRDPEEVIRYKRQAISFLKQAAHAGSVDALISLSNAYDGGVLVEENRALAYAYYLAAQMASPRSVSGAVLQNYQENIDMGAVKDARRAADAIYRKCCVNT